MNQLKVSALNTRTRTTTRYRERATTLSATETAEHAPSLTQSLFSYLFISLLSNLNLPCCHGERSSPSWLQEKLVTDVIYFRASFPRPRSLRFGSRVSCKQSGTDSLKDCVALAAAKKQSNQSICLIHKALDKGVM